MTLKKILSAGLLIIAMPVFAQTLDTNALSAFPASTQRQTYEICKNVKLTPEQQVKLAKAIEKENDAFLKIINANEGVMVPKGKNQLTKMREKSLAEILDQEQLEQYYRGVFDAEADAEGNAIANKLQKKYDLTDQNWKFIRVAFYKIGLESRVIKKLMADQPKKANKKIADLTEYYLKTIEEKGDIKVDPVKMTVTYLKEFNPNDLHK